MNKRENALVYFLYRIRIPYRLGIIIRIGSDPHPLYWHATMNPEYTAWGYITKVYTKFLILHTYWMRLK